MFRMTARLLIPLQLLIAAGCAESGPNYTFAEAGGVVTLHGSPLINASVTFVPEDGPVAVGRTNAEGKFTLMSGTESGAVVGPGKLTVNLVDSDSPGAAASGASDSSDAMKRMQQMMIPQTKSSRERPKNLAGPQKSVVPKKYQSVQTTPLEFTVKEGEDNFFEVQLD